MYYFYIITIKLIIKPTQYKFDRKFPDKPLGSPVSLDLSSALLVLSVKDIYEKLISMFGLELVHTCSRKNQCLHSGGDLGRTVQEGEV